jgi:hypothetical protein
MTINSRFWGVGWRTLLPSIPGRTARLKAIWKRDIRLIARQEVRVALTCPLHRKGEGPSGAKCDQNESHFCRFLNIYRDLVAKPGLLAAARRVPLNPVVPDRHRKDPVHASAEFITHPESRRWAKLFNIRYQMLLINILLALSTSRRKEPNLRNMLTEWASQHEMEHLKQIGQLLPSLPRNSAGGTLRAGAPFETAQFPPGNAKRWDMLRVLIKGSKLLIRELKKMTSPHDERFAILEMIAAFDRNPLMPDSTAAMLENTSRSESIGSDLSKPDLPGAISTKLSALLQAAGPTTFSTDFSNNPTRTAHFRSRMTPCGIPSWRIPRDHRTHFAGRSLHPRLPHYASRDYLFQATPQRATTAH